VASAIGVVDRIGHVGEQRRHFSDDFEVLLGAVFLRALGVVEHAPEAMHTPRLVRLEAVGVEEAHVVAGHHRHAACARRHAGRRR
jgi:hypothetical protein